MRHRIGWGLGSALGWAGALQQVEDLGGSGALVGASCLLGRLGRLGAFVGLLRRGGLVARPGLGRRNVGPVCGDARLFGGGWLLGWAPASVWAVSAAMPIRMGIQIGEGSAMEANSASRWGQMGADRGKC
jgi:hypothetical protein